jgi:hypothetical protein
MMRGCRGWKGLEGEKGEGQEGGGDGGGRGEEGMGGGLNGIKERRGSERGEGRKTRWGGGGDFLCAGAITNERIPIREILIVAVFIEKKSSIGTGPGRERLFIGTQFRNLLSVFV